MHPWQRDGLAAAGSALAIGAIVTTLRALQPYPNPTVAALLLLLVVLGVATTARLRTAVAVSLGATLAFNYFLLPPFHTFSIAEPQNWVVLVVFVIVATIASQLSAAVRQRAAEAVAIAVERAQFAEERQRAEAVRRRADFASALLASFSHDLRTPVTSVRVAVSNLLNEALPPAERQGQARLAIEQLDRLTRVFQDILDMARIDASAVQLERQWVTPAELVDVAIAYVGPVLATRDLRISAEEEREVQLDPKLTATALAHLLENAAHHSADDAPVEIRGWVDAAGIQLAVRDYGDGLEAADIAHAFEPFYRNAKARHASGSGLGLAITRGLLAVEGGRVWCENAEGGGARFWIAVPAPSRTTSKDAS
jgi:two-component system sensor histidine kinase KdpD